MRKSLTFFLLLGFITLAVQCERKHGIQYDYIYEIPKADHYAFEEGDILLYRSSRGVTDSVRVKEVSFYSEPGAGINGFGVTYTYMMDHYRVTLETMHDQWDSILQNVLGGTGVDARCLNIETYFSLQTYYDPEEQPGTTFSLGCGENGGLVVAEGDPQITELTFQGAIYRNIYFHSLQKGDSAGLDVYWNLKYGIIHFGGILDRYYISWDLVGAR